MASKGITAQRDELVEEQLRGIRETLGELKAALATVSANLDAVRTAELASVRAELAKNEAVFMSTVSDLRASNQSAVNDLRSTNQAELARHDAELKLLRYQMGRTVAMWSLVSGGVMSAIVAAVMAIVLRR